MFKGKIIEEGGFMGFFRFVKRGVLFWLLWRVMDIFKV